MEKDHLADKIFTPKNIDNLPEPVKQYFNLVLIDGQPYIKSVQLTHSGRFKTSAKGDWKDIHGEQYFKTDKPEFIWTGKTKLFKAIDKFADGKGHLTVLLFSIIPIVRSSGKSVNQAELLRWLGESFWFPTNLLPTKNLNWLPIDSLKAKLQFTYMGLTVSYLVSFNEKGEIIQLETERYKDKGNLEKWIGKASEYKDFEGIKVPTHIEATWRLQECDFQYVDFYVDTVKYEFW